MWYLTWSSPAAQEAVAYGALQWSYGAGVTLLSRGAGGSAGGSGGGCGGATIPPGASQSGVVELVLALALPLRFRFCPAAAPAVAALCDGVSLAALPDVAVCCWTQQKQAQACPVHPQSKG